MDVKKPPTVFDFGAERPHVMIVEARFYDEVSDLLLKGAKEVLDRSGVSYEVYTVPGALEIPAAIAIAVKSLNFDAMRRRFEGYIALGCVIKGGTRHDIIVGDESARGLQEMAIRNTLAIGNGILTVETQEQAMERADPLRMNKGGGAAEACLRMVELKRHFRLSAKRRWVAR